MNKKLFAGWLAAILGNFSWSCPPWLICLRRKMAASPRLMAVLFILILATAYGYYWYKKQPMPHLVTASIIQPQITPVAKTLVPDMLTIDFGIRHRGFTPKSVVPLNSIGKDISQDVVMKPRMPGKWVWQTDSRLVFTPGEDWPAAQQYNIEFAKKVFARHIKMEKWDYSFSTLPFKASIVEFKFYQDPVNPQVRQAVATVNFNYPVDANSLEKNTSLVLQTLKDSNHGFGTQHFKLNFTYDENKRIAYIHSESLPLPDTTRYLVLTLDKGIKAAKGSAVTEDTISQQVVVPDAASYFKVSSANALVVRNEQDRPLQVIAVQTTLGVTDSELGRALHVYLLPQDYPATVSEAVKQNYSWQNPGEVTDSILKLSSSVNLQPIPADRDFATLHSYQISVPAGRYVYLKLDKGVKSFGDYVLATDFSAVAKVPDYPKEIGFLHQGALLSPDSEKKLSVSVRGLPAVKFQIARVLPDNVNQLITQTQGSFNNPHFINVSFNENNISEIFSETQSFSADPAKAQYTALDIGKYLSTKLNTGGPQGLFLLQATGWDTVNNLPLDVKASRLILMTDLGLIVKDNADGSHDVFVESIAKGVPLSQVSVTVTGKNGLGILTRVTDAQGRAHFPVLKDFINEREPVVYLARVGNDVSFIPYNNADRQLNFSRYDIGGIYNDPEIQTLTAYLFSDRGIYRPGDIAHVGMIIKQAYAQPQPAGLPLEVIVTDPRGTTVTDQKRMLDATGLMTLDIPTTATSLTGQYTINLFIVKDSHPDSLLGSTVIRVADFQPDRMRITSHLSTEQSKGWISPAELSAKVNLWNLYGAPAVDRKISANMVLTPQRIQFSSYPDYTFVDPLFDPAKPPKVFTDTLADAKTDKNGEAQFDLNLERFDKATWELTFSAQGFESEGGRSVAAESTALVSPLAYFIGYKADGDLRYIKQNDKRSINFIAINSQLKQQSVENLKIQLAALQPVTTLVKNADGTFQYQSLIQTHVIESKSFTIDGTGTDYSLSTDKIGDFVVTVLDQNKTELSKFKYSVAGASQLPLAKNAELAIKLDKTEYKADEDIQLQITAPYTGTGLITIERDKVYTVQWFRTNTTSSIQKIHIPKDFQGNGYVNVAFVRDWNSPEIFVSPLSYSIAPFSVNHDNHAIKIDLVTPVLARPGEPFTMQYKSDKPGKMILFAVDEGILQVANYKTPDPLGYFFQKHALEVITQQTVDQILPKFLQDRELSAFGGDAGEEALRSHLNPFKRKTDLPVVYWSGIVDTDVTPRQLVYQVPDYFNGTLRVMAVAVSSDAVGAAEKKSEVRGEFVINPNVPTFVAPGDEFEITASIANNVKNSKVNVQLAATSQLEIIGDSNQIVDIDEGQEKTVRYKLRAKDLPGAAQVNFVARYADKSAKMDATLSVRPANNYLTTVMSGMTTDSDKTLTIDRSLYLQYRHVDAAASGSPLILLVGLQRYLDNFPYGCTEQLVSQAFPLVVSAGESWLINDPARASQKIATTIQMLGQRQMSSGAFSYWPNVGEYESNAFASVYAMHFLTEAREHGFIVPADMVQSGINYLKDLATQDVTTLAQARIQAYAIYILTRNEIVTTNYITHLQLYLDQDKKHIWQKDIASAYMAATWELMKSDQDARRLISYYQLNSHDVSESDFYNQSIADAQYIYLLAKQFPDLLQKSEKEGVMALIASANTNGINTLFSSYTSLALNAIAQTWQSSLDKPLTISVTMSNNQKKTFSAQNAMYVNAELDDSARNIFFNNPSKQMLFYQLTQSGFDKKILSTPEKNHIEIDREYRTVDGKKVDEAVLGNEVEVHIQVRSLDDTTVDNVAIVDLLPGGFEVVNDSVKTDNMDYADVREDRVIFFGSVLSDVKEIVYRIKPINMGEFTVPPIFANSLYNPQVYAHNVSGHIKVITH